MTNKLFIFALCAIIAVSLCACGSGTREASSSLNGVITSIDGSKIVVSLIDGTDVTDAASDEKTDAVTDSEPAGPIEKEPDGIGDPRQQREENNEGAAVVDKEPDGIGDPRAQNNAETSVSQGETVTINVESDTEIFDADGNGKTAIKLSELKPGDAISVTFDKNGKALTITRNR